MKSALEIALENTRDIQPEETEKSLPEDAKEKIRQINREFDAKIAEVDTRVNARIREMVQQYGPQEVNNHASEIHGQVRQEKDRINAERREQTEAVRKEYSE